MSAPTALDTSVSVPLLVATHVSHRPVVARWSGRPVTLPGHALAETYSVLTRLSGDIRSTPADAARVLQERFAEPLLLSPHTAAALPEQLSQRGVCGGAVHDALVASAAAEHGATLATPDERARATYRACGVRVEVVA